MTTRTTRRAVLAVPAVALAGLLGPLAACGGSTPEAPPATSRDAAAAAKQDAAFATAMFDHRHRALQLVGLVAQHGRSSDVLAFAGGLQTGYDGEMRRLEAMLEGWGRPVPHVEGHTDLGADIPGLLTAAQLTELRSATPEAFEKQLLTVLAAHEERGVAEAEKEKRLGADPGALAYAGTVVDEGRSTLAEIATLLAARS